MSAKLIRFNEKTATRAVVQMYIASGVVATLFLGNIACVWAGSSGSGVQRTIEPSPIQEDPNAIAEYWTDTRMERAQIGEGFATPAPQPPLLPGADHSGYVPMPTPYTSNALSRMNGMLFYRNALGGVLHCSAAVITSRSLSVVITAAHCVHDHPGWHEMMMFVPAYNGSASGTDRAPFGKWPVKQAFIPYDGADHTEVDDIAVLSIYPRTTPMGPSQTVEQAVGGGLEPLVTNGGSFPTVQLIGYPGVWYPGDGPYQGEQRRCESPAIPYGQSLALTLPYCAAQSGNSGGPLVESGSSSGPRVVAVVRFTLVYSRLLSSTFPPIYAAADEAARR